MIEVDINLQIGDFLLDVQFDSGAGITALFGPSGAGKTLTLRSIAGLTRPTSGRIVLDGRVLLDTQTGIDVPTRDRHIGYVFQQYALFPHLNVERNISFGLGRRRPDRAERVTALLEIVGLEGFGDRRPFELSGGQQQRVAIARALATEPSIIVADEPTGNLDSRTSIEVMTLFQELNDEGVTILLVTHEPDIAEYHRRIVEVRDGQIIRDHPVENRKIARDELKKLVNPELQGVA